MKYFLLIFIAIPLFVNAQDLMLKNPGVAARSLGGAYTALADDATAIFWNPAGLAIHKNYEFYLSGMYENYKISSGIANFETKRYTASHLENMFIGFKFPIPIKIRNINLIGAISVHELIDFSYSYKSEEFSEVQEGDVRAYFVSIAYPYNDYLRFGLAYAFLHGNRDLQFKNLSGGLWGEDETEKYTYRGFYFLNFGLSYDLRPFRLGFSIKPAFELNEKSDTLRATIRMPFVLGIGVAYNPAGKLRYSADFEWGQFNNLNRKFEKAFERYRKGEEQRLGSKNAYQVRLGTEYSLEYKRLLIPLRIGVGVDRKFLIDLNNKQIQGAFLCGGFGLIFGNLTLDLGIEHNKTPYQVFNQGNYDEKLWLYMLSIKYKKASS